MNLQKLFKLQQELDNRITPVPSNALQLKQLALLVELGECANEWRGFKFWSQDQAARVSEPTPCPVCKGCKYCGQGMLCLNCEGGYVGTSNLLLEEYVDVLHFTLSIGNMTGNNSYDDSMYTKRFLYTGSIDYLFMELYSTVSNPYFIEPNYYSEYVKGFKLLITLGHALGFTEEDIIQAYYDKNAVNHARQDTGY